MMIHKGMHNNKNESDYLIPKSEKRKKKNLFGSYIYNKKQK